MPNYCINNLYCDDDNINGVTKPYQSIDEHGNPFLDFNKIVPMPPELDVVVPCLPKDPDAKEIYQSNFEKYGYENWYDWRVAKWGTKWNSFDCIFNESCACLITAWSPPEPVIIELAVKTGKTFVLEYIEEGEAFVGRLTATPTGHTDECYSIDEAPHELLDSVGYEPWGDDDQD